VTGLPEHVRVFTAIPLRAEIRRALREEATVLLSGAGKMSLVPEENYHVTLKFLGDVHRDDLPAVHAAVEDAAGLLREAEIEVEGIGAFPRFERARVVWAGVSDPEGILTPVHARLNESFARFGAKREKKRYHPHVTLARVRGPFDAARVRERMDDAGELWFGAEPAREVVLLMSELDRRGPARYTVLGRYGQGG
jgi:2'-5' RNA ligase